MKSDSSRARDSTFAFFPPAIPISGSRRVPTPVALLSTSGIIVILADDDAPLAIIRTPLDLHILPFSSSCRNACISSRDNSLPYHRQVDTSMRCVSSSLSTTRPQVTRQCSSTDPAPCRDAGAKAPDLAVLLTWSGRQPRRLVRPRLSGRRYTLAPGGGGDGDDDDNAMMGRIPSASSASLTME